MMRIYLPLLLILISSLKGYTQDTETHILTILHTNNLNSEVEPLATKENYANFGGFSRLHQQISEIRQEEEYVLLLDAGGFIQGTAYYDFFQGIVEVKAMSMMQYDAVNIGSREFVGGLDRLLNMAAIASFPMLSTNYALDSTILHDVVLPYKIIDKGAMRIGVIGVGDVLQDKLAEANYAGVNYLVPDRVASAVALRLKKEMGCHAVICLTYLDDNTTSTKELSLKDFVEKSEGIDVFIGGKSGEMLATPLTLQNKNGAPVLLAQAGKQGTHLGRIDLTFKVKTLEVQSKQ
ncbi:bifunctional metallophosphatase/5'-nucleotidase [Algivirga pacifica]|uniref:Metallophosphatase n=1 Tax=Algivirga pacifica TaxID=1162670 RepID=A0ABP9CVW3_9BACT